MRVEESRKTQECGTVFAPRDTDLVGYQRLAAAVIAQAIGDLRGKNKGHAEQAEQWLLGSSETVKLFSALAGVHLDTLKAAVQNHYAQVVE